MESQNRHQQDFLIDHIRPVQSWFVYFIFFCSNRILYDKIALAPMNKFVYKLHGYIVYLDYDAKIAKICNRWTFWPVITSQNVQRLQIFAILASFR